MQGDKKNPFTLILTQTDNFSQITLHTRLGLWEKAREPTQTSITVYLAWKINALFAVRRHRGSQHHRVVLQFALHTGFLLS